MRQFLFVVNNGRIAFWQFHRGCLSRRSLNGNVWNDYCQTFWDVWSEANQPEDTEDAILLSDRPDGYGKLPPWFHASDTQASKWTLETFSKIVNAEEFAGKNVKIYLGAKKYDFSSGSPEEVFWLYPREGDLSSQFAAAKEKQIQEEVKQKQRAAETLKKREEELARKRAEEERRAEEAKRAAEEKRKREAELARKRAEEERRAEEARRAAEERRKREAESAEARRVRAIKEAREKVHALQDEVANEFEAFYALSPDQIKRMRMKLRGIAPEQIDFQDEVALVLKNCSVAQWDYCDGRWSPRRTEDDSERDKEALWKMFVLVVLKYPDIKSRECDIVFGLEELSRQKRARPIKEGLKNYAKSWLGFTETN